MTKNEIIAKLKNRLNKQLKFYKNNVRNDYNSYITHMTEIFNCAGLTFFTMKDFSNEEIDSFLNDLKNEFEPDFSHIESFNQLTDKDKTLLNATNASIDEIKGTFRYILDNT